MTQRVKETFGGISHVEGLLAALQSAKNAYSPDEDILLRVGPDCGASVVVLEDLDTGEIEFVLEGDTIE